MNVANHLWIGTGQGLVEVGATADEGVHQAIELHRGAEHATMPAVIQRRGVPEADH
ncbi:hypothetical protein D3C76_1732960 [compost metagenome]